MVSMIPFGLLSGFAGDQEIRITKLDETGFGFRLCKENQMMVSGNTKARKEFNRKLDRVKDKEEFYRQLAAPDVLELKEEQLLIAKDYVVTVDTDVEIYDLNQMEKLEVGKQGNIKKTLFLTEPDGKRHAILSTTKGDGRQRAFDQVYERLHKRF